MKQLTAPALLLISLLSPAPAFADGETDGGATSESAVAPGAVVVGVHFGPSLNVFSDMELHLLPRLEIGWIAPMWDGRVQPFLTGAYNAPTAAGTVEDTRLPAGEFEWDLRQKELMLGLGLNLRFLPAGSRWNGYVALAPQVFLLETVVHGESGGEAFGENRETDTQFGVYSALGGEVVLGPGALFVQAGLTWSKLDGDVTGESSTGAISPSLGYRLMF